MKKLFLIFVIILLNFMMDISFTSAGKRSTIDISYSQFDINKFVKKNYPELYKLAIRESGGSSGQPNYKAYNNWGYIGAWAIGEKYVRYYGYKNVTLEAFKNNSNIFTPEAQLEILLKMINRNKKHIRCLDKYIGREFNGIFITQNGLIYACHLAGAGNVIKYFKTDGKFDPDDNNGVRLSDYLNLKSKKGV